MERHNTSFSWTSTLKESDVIKLKAEEKVEFTEIWRMDVTPIWHIEASGIPLIKRKSTQGVYQPEWRPWPGEEVEIKVTRPKGVSGQAVTIDRALLELTPGKRLLNGKLTLDIRTSRTGNHQIELPEPVMIRAPGLKM